MQRNSDINMYLNGYNVYKWICVNENYRDRVWQIIPLNFWRIFHNYSTHQWKLLLSKGKFSVMALATCIHNTVNWRIVSKSFRSTCKLPVHYFVIPPLIMAKSKLPTGNISIVGYFNKILNPRKHVDSCERNERQICPSLDDTLWITYLTVFFLLKQWLNKVCQTRMGLSDKHLYLSECPNSRLAVSAFGIFLGHC